MSSAHEEASSVCIVSVPSLEGHSRAVRRSTLGGPLGEARVRLSPPPPIPFPPIVLPLRRTSVVRDFELPWVGVEFRYLLCATCISPADRFGTANSLVKILGSELGTDAIRPIRILSSARLSLRPLSNVFPSACTSASAVDRPRDVSKTGEVSR